MNLFSRLLRRFQRPKRSLQTSFRSYKQNLDRRRRPIFKPTTSTSIPLKGKTRSRLKIAIKWRAKSFFALLAVAALLYLLLFTKLFEIQKIDVIGDADTLPEQQQIQEAFSTLIGKNLLFFGANLSEEKLQKDFPSLKRVRIQKQGFHGIKVSLESYVILAKVRILDEAGVEIWTLVNEQGHLAEGSLETELPSFTMEVQGTELELSSLQMDPVVLAAILQAKSSFEAKFNLRVLEMSYLKRARELHLFTEREFEVWIDLSEDIETQLTKLKKAMTKLDIYSAPLEYIDLRISGQDGEKVIYKLK